jgi:hypothetical protein
MVEAVPVEALLEAFDYNPDTGATREEAHRAYLEARRTFQPVPRRA